MSTHLMSAAQSPKSISPVDAHVGQRVRVRRLQLGMSQEKLANALGLTFQQVQKYEKGTNRISVGRLRQISEILSAPLTWFYDGAETFDAPLRAGTDTLLWDDATLELARAFQKLTDPGVRSHILGLVTSLASERRDGVRTPPLS